jgi:hypothetical protein
MCKEKDCKKRPNFNKEGETTPLYCSAHKKEGMVDVKHKKTCLECKKQPYFNKAGETTALYCAVHKKEGMVDVRNKTCKSEWCSTFVKKKYDGYCLFCYMNLFPDKPVSLNYKTKEYSVVDYIKTKFPSLNWIADKIISGGCSKRRPDLLLDLFYQIIIIEVDESQHIDYDCSCQNKRIMELSQDLGHRPIIFIRFNPDDYEKDGTIISSGKMFSKKSARVCISTESFNNVVTCSFPLSRAILDGSINYTSVGFLGAFIKDCNGNSLASPVGFSMSGTPLGLFIQFP